MKVLTIGTDSNLFQTNSAVRERIQAYGARMEELHIIVFTLKTEAFGNVRLGSNVFIYPTNSLSRWFYVFDAIRLGRKVLKGKTSSSDRLVISSQDPFESGLAAACIAQMFRAPLHMQVHTDFLGYYFSQSLLQHIRIMIARFLLPRADAVRVVSQHIADSIERADIRLKRPLQILPIRVNVDRIVRAVPDTTSDLHALFPQFRHVALMACRLSSEKRITDAIQAVAMLEGVGLVIAGEGPERDTLEKEARERGVSDRVVFLGLRRDIPQLLKSADVFLSTSKFEGYGMSMVEAALAHCPVVSSNVGFAADDGILRNGINALVCPVGDTKCFAAAIRRLVKNVDDRRLFAERLAVDIQNVIPSESSYVDEYVQGVERAMN